MPTLDEKIDKLAGAVTETQEMIGHVVKHMVTKEEFGQLAGKVSTLDGKVTQLDGKVSTLDGKVTQLDGKVSTLDGKVSRVITAVVNLQGDMSDVKERMVTRELFDQALTKEDAMTVILQRIDHERVATVAWLQRLEGEITMLKRHLHLAV